MVTHYLEYPAPASSDISTAEPRRVLIFFITGNPGLIDYYALFLSTLSELIRDSASLQKTARFHIYGQDLAGFNDSDHEPFTAHRKPHDLETQIQHTLKALKNIRIEDGPRQGQPYDDVLLAGHSVGTYIALELCHRVLKDPGLAPSLNLGSGILLFPTIHHISSSPSGRKLDLLRRIPILGDNAYRIAQGFLHLLPRRGLHWIVRRVMGFPVHAAEVTTRWLKSRDGVWQALHMGMDEMKVIGEDKWDDELWGIVHEAQAHEMPVPKFCFFFGKNDHWVASHYRDEFIQKRQRQPERTQFVVDEGNIPHAFCIHHSETVAEKVHHWITDMYSAD
ncbi:Uu.00g133380.m01.CDS01 [Anthostomella pinea]|uniref:Uu.00g133380.m01.CDS01 n=1 Tax=Anthostomella pinea TaxID=933095 RepID=A0AAI8VTT3_9PEZI|nr:Uu.00g133380.m01.CDS01 [Anthostomella pinea]